MLRTRKSGLASKDEVWLVRRDLEVELTVRIDALENRIARLESELAAHRRERASTFSRR